MTRIEDNSFDRVMSFDSDWQDVADRRVTISAQGEAWSRVVVDACSQADVNVVVSGVEEGDLVTLSLVDAPLAEALSVLGDLRNVAPIYESGLVRFRAESASSVALVDRGFLNSDQALAVVDGLASGSDGTVVRRAGTHILAAGDERFVNRVDRVSQMFAAAEPDQWLINVWVIELSEELRRRVGVEVDLGINASMVFQSAIAEAVGSVLVESVLRTDRTSRHSRLMNRASLVFVEGETSRLQSGQSVPIPQRTVSPQGTVQTTGFEYVDVGVLLTVSGQAVPTGLQLNIQPEVSAISGFVEQAPVISRRSMDINCLIRSGDWLVLAGLDDFVDSSSVEGIMRLDRQVDRSLSNVVVVMRGVRVGHVGAGLSE